VTEQRNAKKNPEEDHREDISRKDQKVSLAPGRECVEGEWSVVAIVDRRV